LRPPIGHGGQTDLHCYKKIRIAIARLWGKHFHIRPRHEAAIAP
jgi:hypothetical protein